MYVYSILQSYHTVYHVVLHYDDSQLRKNKPAQQIWLCDEYTFQW